ncbi:MAG: polysaccharide deacetylase family protein [Hyphomicrobium sp.]
MFLAATPAVAQTMPPACHGDPALAFPSPRIVEIDTSGGPIFGSFTKQSHEAAFLRPKEVVLTFDDGPMPWITRSILDTLGAYCARATFFAVGRMAIAYPDVVRDVAARGHTLASHTMTHPFNMPRMSAARAQDEIERGFAAVSAAAGHPIAPFFRFPGLADSAALLDYLQQRGIAAFTVDVVTNDSYITSPSRLAERTLAEIERAGGGIVLFHDIKRATAKALPEILKALRTRGYTIVHLTSAAPVAPRVELLADFSDGIAAARKPPGAPPTLMPFYGTVGPNPALAAEDPGITRLAPEPRSRLKGASSPHIANSDGTATAVSPWKANVRSRRKRAAN